MCFIPKWKNTGRLMVLVLYGLIICQFNCFAQSTIPINDYEEGIRNLLLDDNRDSARIWSKKYLEDVKFNGDSKEKVKAFYYLIKVGDRGEMLRYSDSLIAISQNEEFGYYPALAHYIKGTEYFKQGQMMLALDKFVIADSLLPADLNVEEKLWNKIALAQLRKRTNDLDGALKEFLTISVYCNENGFYSEFGYCAFSLYIIYTELNQLDKAREYIEKALVKIQPNDRIAIHLNYAKGVLAFKSNNYLSALEKLEIASIRLDSISDLENLAYADSYLGESYFRLNDSTAGVAKMQRVIQVYLAHGVINDAVRSAIETMAVINRKKQNSKEELKMLNHLIRIDSLGSLEMINLQKKFYQKHEKRQWLKRKDNLIAEMNSQNQQKSTWLSVLGISILLLGFGILYQRRLSKSKMESYEKIIRDYNNRFKEPVPKNNKTTLKIPPRKDIEVLNLAFEKYERENSFTRKDFSKDFIKTDTGVNAHYISDYFREIKEKTLIEYTNEKRIELAITKILEEKNFRKYTMAAMANEVGFNNSSTFKRVFVKRTGNTPLEFIRKVQES